MTLDDHIAAARALGPAQPAVLHFLDIIESRRHLPVRTLDFAVRVHHLIHMVRCRMEDLQYATLCGRDRLVKCWLGQFNFFDGDEDRDAGQLWRKRNADGLR